MVKAMLRWSMVVGSDAMSGGCGVEVVIETGDLWVDIGRHVVTRDEKVLALSSKEFGPAAFLARNGECTQPGVVR